MDTWSRAIVAESAKNVCVGFARWRFGRTDRRRQRPGQGIGKAYKKSAAIFESRLPAKKPRGSADFALRYIYIIGDGSGVRIEGNCHGDGALGAGREFPLTHRFLCSIGQGRVSAQDFHVLYVSIRMDNDF